MAKLTGEPRVHSRRRRVLLILAALGLVLVGLGALVTWEMRTSSLQARLLAPVAADITWSVGEGPSESSVYPESGPYDLRLGYVRLPQMIERAGERGFGIAEQAVVSPRFRTSVEDWGLFPIYEAKARAGITVLDHRNEALFARPYPTLAYPSFESVPPVVWRTLLYLESRTILDPDRPHKNPAVEWPRLIRATGALTLQFLGRDANVAGASTLATQLEKLRHAPGGLTSSPGGKLVQMATASLRAYRMGRETLPARRQIVVDYLNSMPLAAQHGQGEVTGLGDGLQAWFGRDFNEANRRLADVPVDTLVEHGSELPDPARVLPAGAPQPSAFWYAATSGDEAAGEVADSTAAPGVPMGPDPDLQAQGAVYREVLSLLLAQRRPSYYLAQAAGVEALRLLTDQHLEILRDGGVISRELAEAARKAQVRTLATSPPAGPGSTLPQKGVDAIRIELLDILTVPDLYALDRLDLTVRTTLDGPAQRATTDFLRKMADPEFVRARGFDAYRLLDRGDPSKVVYSVVLHERTDRGNLVRIETDNLDSAFNVAESSLLELGSTAKLRTLISYLEVMQDLHSRLSEPDAAAADPSGTDRLTRWARNRLRADPGIELREFLEASMRRTYSASPHERFVTGGGVQTFTNFDDTYDDRIITVSEAFRESVNLVFVRVMEDVVDYWIYGSPGSKAHVLTDLDSPLRQEYLEWFADREGREFVDRFIPRFRDSDRGEILRALVEDRRLSPQRVAWVYRTVAPDASWQELAVVLQAAAPGPARSEDEVRDLFRRADPEPHGLADLGYLASVHPLELWVARHLIEHPEATRAELMEASTGVRQDVYRWLFETSRQSAQDRRIHALLEVEAFAEIHAGWSRLGYPFDHIVPSLGSAIGSSGDRPTALGELVGILVNDGVRMPTHRVEELHFAAATPFETRMAHREPTTERVLASEIAQVVRTGMVDVVENGTGRRVAGALRQPDGTAWTVGGKSGTGENLFRVFGPGGAIVESRIVNRTAAFVFFIGDRYFGVVTAYVPGAAADDFGFTSSLATHLLRELAPVLQELAREPGSLPSP